MALLVWRAGEQRSPRLAQFRSDVRYAESTTNNQPAMAYDAVDDDQNIELATGKALAFFVLELFSIVGLPPSRFDPIQDDPHAVRRLRHRAWLTLGKKWPLQHALLRGRMPGAALERGRPRQALQENKKSGGAEQYNANKKYTEAVAVAAEACADDTKGQTCYICTQALALENQGGPGTHVCVPRDGGLRARVVPGGAGEDFGRGGRGEQFGASRC